MDREVPPATGYLDAVAFRYSSYDTPLWARNNRDPGRWHSVGDRATQYMTLEPEGAWAELARAENLRSDADFELVRMPIWALKLSQQGLVDYSSFERAEAAGFPPDALVDDDYARCQIEGKRLRDLGFSGVVAPSAALPGATNVTIFGRRMVSSWSAPTRLASSIPGCIVAVGRAPLGLATRTRHFGEQHSGLAAHLDGQAEAVRLEQFSPEEPEGRHRRGGTRDEDEGTGAAG
jgi:RES domain